MFALRLSRSWPGKMEQREECSPVRKQHESELEPKKVPKRFE